MQSPTNYSPAAFDGVYRERESRTVLSADNDLNPKNKERVGHIRVMSTYNIYLYIYIYISHIHIHISSVI